MDKKTADSAALVFPAITVYLIGVALYDLAYIAPRYENFFGSCVGGRLPPVVTIYFALSHAVKSNIMFFAAGMVLISIALLQLTIAIRNKLVPNLINCCLISGLSLLLAGFGACRNKPVATILAVVTKKVITAGMIKDIKNEIEKGAGCSRIEGEIEKYKNR